MRNLVSLMMLVSLAVPAFAAGDEGVIYAGGTIASPKAGAAGALDLSRVRCCASRGLMAHLKSRTMQSNPSNIPTKLQFTSGSLPRSPSASSLRAGEITLSASPTKTAIMWRRSPSSRFPNLRLPFSCRRSPLGPALRSALHMPNASRVQSLPGFPRRHRLPLSRRRRLSKRPRNAEF